MRSSSTSSSSLSLSSSSTASYKDDETNTTPASQNNRTHKDIVKTNKVCVNQSSTIDNSNNDNVVSNKMSKYEFTNYMTNWLRTNFYYPYPDHDMIIQMSKLCNRSETTILNWLSNNRSRKWYAIMENVYAMDRNANTFYEDCMNVFDGKPVRLLVTTLVTTDNNDNEPKEHEVVVVVPPLVATKETTAAASDPTIEEEDDDNVSTTTLSLDELMMIYNVIDDNDNDCLSFKSDRIFNYCCGDDDNDETKKENDGNGNDEIKMKNDYHHENNHGRFKIVSPTSTMSYDYNNNKSDTLDENNKRIVKSSSNDSFVRSFFNLDDHGDDLYYNGINDNLSITTSSSVSSNIHMLHRDNDDDYYVMDDVDDDHYHRLSTSKTNLRPWKRQKLTYDL